MELEQLRIFMAVAESGSFTGGAKKLYISHSTTSRTVSALEDELGLRLFKRGNHIEELTPAGRLLYEEAGRLCAMAEALPEKLRKIAEKDID